MRRASALNVTGDAAALARASVFFGFSLRDTSGSANTVTIYDNASAASGTVIASVAIAANGSQTLSIPNGLGLLNGLYIDTTAAVVGSVWYG